MPESALLVTDCQQNLLDQAGSQLARRSIAWRSTSS